MNTKKQLTGILLAAAIALLPALLPSAQAATIDSLEHVLQAGKPSNDERMKLYIDLYLAYNRYDLGKAKLYIQEGLALARKVNDGRRITNFLSCMADACLAENKMDSAIYYCEQALRLAQKRGDVKNANANLVNMAQMYQLKGMYSLALQFLMEALPYYEKPEADGEAGKGNLFCQIGTIHYQMQNYERSLPFLLKAESAYREMGNKHSLAVAVLMRTQVQLELHLESMPGSVPVEELMASAGELLELAQEVNHLFVQKNACLLLGVLYMETGDYANAQSCIDSAFQLVETVGMPAYQTHDILTLQSALYYRQGKYAASEAEALKALALEGNDIVRNYEPMTHLVLSGIRMGKAERAEEYFTKYWAQVKDYMRAEYEKSISEMEVKYETDKKEHRIVALEKERALYFWLGLAIAVIFLLTLLVMFLWMKWAKKERQLVATQSVLDGEIAERTRLARDLHDGLGGMLSVVKLNLGKIRDSAPAKDAERYNDVLNLLSDSITELHRVTHNLMSDSLARSGLKDSLADFCNRIPGVDFQYLGAADRLDPKLEVMIYRTVHELVNNALRHANAEHILVQIIEEGNRLSLVVQDDGQGFDPKAAATGLGLKNIRHRVAANNGHFEISSEPNVGTEISVEFKI